MRTIQESINAKREPYVNAKGKLYLPCLIKPVGGFFGKNGWIDYTHKEQ